MRAEERPPEEQQRSASGPSSNRTPSPPGGECDRDDDGIVPSRLAVSDSEVVEVIDDGEDDGEDVRAFPIGCQAYGFSVAVREKPL